MHHTLARPSRFGRGMLLAVVTVLAALAVSVSSAHAETVGWDAFAAPDGSGGSLSDGDTISLETETNVASVPDGSVEVRLATIDGMTWRKGIEIDKRARYCNWFTCWTYDKMISGQYLQDYDHGPSSRFIPVSDTRNQLGFGQLRFGKAKGFGAFWPSVHDVRWDAEHAVSKNRYTFTWVTD